MSTRNKIIISVSTLCLVAVVAVVAIVAVFANATQTVSTNVNVTYKAVDVIGTVTANAYEGANGEAQPFTGEVTFSGSEDNDVKKSLTAPKSFVLTKSTQFVVFEFIFENNSSQHDFTAELKYTATGTDANITVTVTKDGKQKGAEEKQWLTDVAEETSGSGVLISSSDLTVTHGQTAYAYVLVKVTDTTKDATFAGGFAWTLTNVD